MAAPMLLSSTFEAGNQIGPILASVFFLLLLLELVYVFVKYVITSRF